MMVLVLVWYVQDDGRRVDVMRRFFTAGPEHVWLRHGEVYTTIGDVGCCIWVPQALNRSVTMTRTCSTRLVNESFTTSRGPWRFVLFDAIHPSEPRYYLPCIAVEPYLHKRGVGAAMLAPVLAKCDRERIVAYLEADDRRPFHERNGFSVIVEIALPDGPTIWQVERLPSSAPSRSANVVPNP